MSRAYVSRSTGTQRHAPRAADGLELALQSIDIDGRLHARTVRPSRGRRNAPAAVRTSLAAARSSARDRAVDQDIAGTTTTTAAALRC